MKIAIIGTGIQALKRIAAIQHVGEDEIVFIASSSKERAKLIANKYNIPFYGSEQDLQNKNDIEAVVVCGTTDKHFQSCLDAIAKGRQILCEKPLTKTVLEAKELLMRANEKNILLKCGFNHRHYPGIVLAKSLVKSLQFGKILSIRCSYGICGRENFKDEWRSNPEKTIGGQLIEQGVHAIDLFHFFGLDIESVYCVATNLYFDTDPIEDNAFFIGKCANKIVCTLNTSFTEWVNNFEFHINLENGYIKVLGLGPSYGGHSIEYSKKDFKAPFSKSVVTYNPIDVSFINEWLEFKREIFNIKSLDTLVNDESPVNAIKIVEISYKSSNLNQSVMVCG